MEFAATPAGRSKSCAGAIPAASLSAQLRFPTLGTVLGLFAPRTGRAVTRCAPRRSRLRAHRSPTQQLGLLPPVEDRCEYVNGPGNRLLARIAPRHVWVADDAGRARVEQRGDPLNTGPDPLAERFLVERRDLVVRALLVGHRHHSSQLRHGIVKLALAARSALTRMGQDVRAARDTGHRGPNMHRPRSMQLSVSGRLRLACSLSTANVNRA